MYFGAQSLKGLEHLMQSIGLGGLQLEHAVDKHRPDGYQVPDFLSRVSIDDYRSQDDESMYIMFPRIVYTHE